MKTKTQKPLIKNIKSIKFYTKAEEKEFEKFYNKIIETVKKIYNTVEISNNYKTFKKPKKSTSKTLERFFNFIRNNWLLIFYANSEKIIEIFTDIAYKNYENSVKKTLEDIDLKFSKKEREEVLSLYIQRNVDLIKNMSTQAVNDIQNIITNGIFTNKDFTEIEKDLKNVKNISDNRIKRIATDQTHKLGQVINRIEQEDVGIEYYEWLGLDDGRERPEHLKLNNKIFKWGDIEERQAIIDKKGTRGYPGEAVCCRCQALAYYVDLTKYKPVWLGNNKGYKFIKK